MKDNLKVKYLNNLVNLSNLVNQVNLVNHVYISIKSVIPVISTSAWILKYYNLSFSSIAIRIYVRFRTCLVKEPLNLCKKILKYLKKNDTIQERGKDSNHLAVITLIFCYYFQNVVFLAISKQKQMFPQLCVIILTYFRTNLYVNSTLHKTRFLKIFTSFMGSIYIY